MQENGAISTAFIPAPSALRHFAILSEKILGTPIAGKPGKPCRHRVIPRLPSVVRGRMRLELLRRVQTECKQSPEPQAL